MITTDTKDCVIVRCGGCKRIVYAAVNDIKYLDRDEQKAIGAMAASGCSVEHMTVEQVRQSKEFGCRCHK